MNDREQATLDAMFRHMESLEEDLRPSAFWAAGARHNEDLLKRYGVENFKRTVNQNYFNWIPLSRSDNQYRQVEAYWQAHPDPRALQAELEDWDLLHVAFLQGNPFLDPAARALYAQFVGMLWHFVSHGERNGTLERLAEPELGNPIRTRLGGRLISQDLANSAREASTTLHAYQPSARRCVLGELGAGYGRVAHVILATHPVQYVVIDVPPALFVSQWYLTRLFPERRVFAFRPFQRFEDIDEELAAADIAFLTPDQFYQLPDRYFDVFLTISSLAEMSWSQISQYLALMACKTKSRIYIKQWRTWTNPLEGITVQQADYDLPAGWRKRIDRVDAVQDLFFETLWEAR
jgi:putative sugar O-methyltransferase